MPETDRTEVLARECGEDAELRAEVDALLRAEAEAGGFMCSPTADESADDASEPGAVTTARPHREQPGTRIGPYKLLQLIGEGGFGSVFLAEQEKPVSRKVALKIIKLGMDTRAVIARFEAERQALAMMDHPNIAKVLDAGATETGRPYFVMDLVKGDPIVQFCDRNNLSIESRLEVFSQVCAAVQHAHTKGIIHRDIKPSNILVATLDGRPHAKVIDFGIVKATSAKLTEKTLFTEHRALIGTPEYMSPEQAEGSLDIDTRTDVYSLGVLLYELLTGTTPFSGKTLRSAAFAEIQRIIREVEPPKPSTRITQSPDTLASVAAHRQAEPSRLSALVRGELDWIVMKALEKDRMRRYDSAGGLAMDVQRHLRGEPLVAAPPSRSYRLRKAIRRHRVSALVASGFLVLVAAALVISLTLWRRAAQARDAEFDLRARAGAINAFLKDTLTAADPARTRGATRTVREALDEAAQRIEGGAIAGQPEVAAELRATIGKTYFALGLFPQAKSHLQAAEVVQARELGDDHPEVLHTRSQLARCYAWEGESDAAVALARPTLDRQQRVLGEDHPDTLRTLSFLGNGLHLCNKFDEADECLRRALAGQERTLGKDHPDSIETMLYLSWSLNGVSDESVSVAREALERATRALGPDHPHASYAALFLGMAYNRSREQAEAATCLRHALAETRRLFGDEHLRTADCMAELGTALGDLGEFDECIELLRQSMRIARRTYGPGKKWTLRYQMSLGYCLSKAARWAESADVLADAIDQSRRARGNDDFETLNILSTYANTLTKLGRLEEAVACTAEAYNTACRTNGLLVETTRDFGRRYAQLLWKLGSSTESDVIIRRNIDACRSALGPHHPSTIEELYRCAWNFYDDGRYAEAEPMARESVDGYRRMESKFKKRMGSPQDLLARIMTKLGRPREALELALEAARAPEASPQHLNLAASYLLSTPTPEPNSPERALEFALKANDLGRYRQPNHLETLAAAYDRTGQTDKAVDTLRKAASLSASKPDVIPSDVFRLASKLLRSPPEVLYDPSLGLELAVKAARHPEASAVHLNFAAWQLLTTPAEPLRQPALALEFALKANNLSGNKDPAYMDTLALAYHRTDDTAKAIALEKSALSLLAPDAPDRSEYEDRLREFENALNP